VIALVLTLVLAAAPVAATPPATPAPAPPPGATTMPAPGPTSTPSAAAPPGPAAALASPEARLDQANGLYLAGDFDGAARAYRALVDGGFEGGSLHLNLGNALARAGARGQAMASWHRALRLDPSDADARANLELARAQNVDRLVGATDPPLSARLVERTSEGLAVGLFGAAWVALWALLWLRSRAARRTRRLLGVAALLAALLASGTGALLAGKAAERRRVSAVVVTPSTPVREGPERTLKTAFELHEGTAVQVLEARGDLARVQLENGLTGWVASADLEVI
jgi:tetratricopeptide (TPR) repeat protein